MSDYSDLKAIAEACQQRQPLRFMRSHGALYIRNDNGIVFDVHQNQSFPEFMAQNKDYADLVLAANPETILALIAKIGSLHDQHDRDSGELRKLCAARDSARRERDQLRAENERLQKLISWQGEGNNKLEVNAGPLMKHMDEHDRLRAEVAGLKTGYEAYERVNAELKAECEALRKDKDRLDALESNFWDVRHDSHPIADTGDSSSSLEIVGHWMDKPFERVIGEDWNENLRAAIDQAMKAPAYPPARPEYPEIDDIPDFTPGNGNSARRRAASLGIDYDAAMGKGGRP